MTRIHPDLLDPAKTHALRQMREDWIAGGLPPEQFDKTFAGAQLSLLEAWWEVQATMVAQLNMTMRGRAALWFVQTRFGRWLTNRYAKRI